MNDELKEAFYQLIEDVETILPLAISESPPPKSAIRSTIAPILRRWICEGLFHSIQRQLRPKIIKFPVYSTAAMRAACETGDIQHWMAPVKIGPMIIGPFRTNDGSNNEKLAKSAPLGMSHLPAGKFFDQEAFFWDNRFIRRQDVLSALANKLGGVHLRLSRPEEDAYIDEICQHFGLTVSGQHYQMIIGEELKAAKMNPSIRHQTYDAMDLVALDTARIFARTIIDHRDQIMDATR